MPVPLCHNTGFTTATIALLMGHHLVLMPRFEPQQFLRLITEHRRHLLDDGADDHAADAAGISRRSGCL